jgi:amidase
MSGLDSIPFMSATALSTAIHRREISCVEVMHAYLERIAAYNPRVNAIVSLRPEEELLASSRALDAELTDGRSRGWMHGFPQAIKDLSPARGLPTTQGSPLFRETIAQDDAIFVARMRAAGAIFVGKTNTPEFGLGSQTHNAVFGATRNAFDHSRTAGGSSGGAAAALAMRLLPVADGSDHAGSLRNPAAFNNVLGLRPSFGRVPGNLEEVFIPQLGVTGPMARNVADLARLLAVQAGPDPRLPLTLAEDPAQFLAPLRRDFEDARIGWLGDLDGHLPIEPGILDLCEGALRVFEDIGCSVEAIKPGYDMEAVWQAWRVLRHWQVGANLAPHYRDPTTRALLKPEAIFEIEGGLKLSAFDVSRASQARSAWYRHVARLFETYDYLILPSAQVFPFAVETLWPREIAGRAMDSYHRWMEVVIPVTMSGCPAISVPVGFDRRGLPMGMQIWGPNRSEFSLLQIAQAYENATGFPKRLPPDIGG